MIAPKNLKKAQAASKPCPPARDRPVVVAAHIRAQEPETRPQTPDVDSDFIEAQAAATLAPVHLPRLSATAEGYRRIPVSLGERPEMKYFTAFTGVTPTTNTWTNFAQWANIANGTGQNQRLGRMIRVHRIRHLVGGLHASGENIALSTVHKVDVTVSPVDLFASSGSDRSEYDYPNPALVRAVPHHTLKSGNMAAEGGLVFVIEHDVRCNVLVRYDASGSVQGPTIDPYFISAEATPTSHDLAVQYWFTDE